MEGAVAAPAGGSDSSWPDEPNHYYTFAGEIPWSPKLAAAVWRWDERPYHYEMSLPGVRFDAEIVAHRFAWESHHSTTNQQGGFLVPSRNVSEELGLLRSPDGLDHVDGEGRPPHGCSSALVSSNRATFYLRRDLLQAYTKRRRREVVIVARGERTPDYELVMKRPRWYVNAARGRADEWAFARLLRDLA
jgi:hypothetical protein